MRGLRHSRTFTLVAVGTLALGIGANTALFSIFNSLLLRAAAGARSGRPRDPRPGLVDVPDLAGGRGPDDGASSTAPSPTPTSSWTSRASGRREPVDATYVSGGIFDVLGVEPLRGRLLQPSDDRADANARVAVISYRFWQRRFAGADSAIGATLTLDRQPFTVVGVMPPDFNGPDVGRVDDVMIPFAAEPILRGVDSGLEVRRMWWLEIMARLKPGTTIEQATAALRTLQPGIRTASAPPEDEGVPRGAVHAGLGGDGPVAAAQPLRDAAPRDAGDGRHRPADRLRQPGQPDAGPGPGAAPRAERPAGARRVAVAGHASARRSRPW